MTAAPPRRIPGTAYAQEIARRVRDSARARATPAVKPTTDGPSIFPQFSINIPMPKCVPPKPPCGGPTEAAPDKGIIWYNSTVPGAAFRAPLPARANPCPHAAPAIPAREQWVTLWTGDVLRVSDTFEGDEPAPVRTVAHVVSENAVTSLPSPDYGRRVIAPPRYCGDVSACGVCGGSKRADSVCSIRGCPWSAENPPTTTVFDGFGMTGRTYRRWKHEAAIANLGLRRTADAPPEARYIFGPTQAAGRYVDATFDLRETKTVTLSPDPDGKIVVERCKFLGPADGAAVRIVTGRPLETYAVAAAPPAPPAPFDPVRAWTDVALAWTRCAYAFAELPVKIAMAHRVGVGF